jgi:pimeloyl-ACP methyl ester carboxylesterase
MRSRPSHSHRRWRRVVTASTLLGVGTLIIFFVRRDTSPVGHFTSAAAKDRFITAYDEAMRDLPRPDKVLDLNTTFGTVRLYRFDDPGTEQIPIVLLPGRASASPVWAGNVPSLRRLAPLYAVDLLGEPGMSIQDRPITTAEEQAQWLHEVFTQLPETQLDLLGLSIGGWTAMNLVLHQPAKVRSVVLLDPVFVYAPMSASAILRSIPTNVRWFPKSLRDNFTSWTANGVRVQDVPIAQMIEAGMQSYALKLPAPRQITDQQLASIKVPVLAILAGRSRMQDPKAAAVTARRLTASNVITYANASHAINGEYPDEIAADISDFRETL